MTDTTPPVLTLTSPSDGAVDVPQDAPIVLTFDETILPGSGNFELDDVTNNSVVLVGTANTSSYYVTVSGNQLFVDPHFSKFNLGHTYRLSLAAGSVQDLAGNPFDGTTDTFTITTTDILPPGPPVSSTHSGALLAQKIDGTYVFIFDETVVRGSGDFQIHKSADGSLVSDIDINDTKQITFFGTQVTFDPKVNLDPYTAYYITLSNGALKDTAGLPYPGFSSPWDYSFITGDLVSPYYGGGGGGVLYGPTGDRLGLFPPAAPSLTAITPTDNATGVPIASNIVLTFDKTVQAGIGALEIHNSADGSLFESIALSDQSQVSFSSNTVTINPLADLAGGLNGQRNTLPLRWRWSVMRQRRKRRFFTAAESAEIWDRWRKGEGLKSIGRVFGKSSSSIFAHISPTGGIRPPPRRRSRLALTLAEREEISRGLAYGHSLRRIACSLERAPSTVSREIARNGGSGPYRAAASDRQAWRRARRPKACKLARYPHLRRVVATHLRRNWSPQQIAGWLKSNHPEDEAFRVSHETIYRSLYVQTRGVLKKALIEHLRTHRPIRRSRHATAKADTRGEIPDMVSIRERPASVDDRAVPGHWEGDLLSGSANSYIVTLVERHTRYVMLAKIPSRDTQTVVSALIKQAKKLPDELYKSLTWDRGKELADHKRFTMATDIAVYFCDPQSPWQRGSNENTNRLLRQYFPKGTDLSAHSQARLNYIARELNERPRMTLGYQSPAERFQACVASTG